TAEQQAPTGAKCSGRRSKQQLQQQLLQQQLQLQQQQQLLAHHAQMAAEVRQVSATPSASAVLMRTQLSSDQRYAIFFLLLFTFVALIVAVLIQHWVGAN